MKVKDLIERLKDYKDYELEIFSKIYTLDTIAEPEQMIEAGKVNVYDIELIAQKVILEFVVNEKVMYMSDIDYIKRREF